MKVLELFAGSRSFSKVAEEMGMETHTTDYKDFKGIDQVCDIFEFDYDKVGFIPDIIWASPPCRTFSIASCSTHWTKDKSYINEFNQSYKDREFIPKTEDAEWGLRIIRKMKEIIAHYTELNTDLYFIIENPRGLLRKMTEMKIYNLERKTIWYCQYGDTRAKPTDIWTNAHWIPRPVCKNGNPDCHHERAPRGSKTGTQGLKGSYERSVVPEELCRQILESIIK
tara:strand:+ start:366 stop:1040 length:675 start_codon:yes stop_codon:yes gene_type:complete